ncbi:MAG: hypothetical protein QN187_12630 [Armatimonadota bacterium]|nr:hypothetical protein [Armatimonadota bacterium]MDR7520578.1 hypothetical protein [Armatimonadota bacterium]MDR7549714.1 hypothetical protein [Armatimonadota bacterium]
MLSGLWIVVVSFVRLPVAYVLGTGAKLAEIGAQGGLPGGREESLPFLNWLLVAGRILIAAAALAILVVFVFIGLFGLQKGLGAFLGSIVSGGLVAFAWVWAAALLLESLSLTVVIANNTRETAEVLRAQRPGRLEQTGSTA